MLKSDLRGLWRAVGTATFVVASQAACVVEAPPPAPAVPQQPGAPPVQVDAQQPADAQQGTDDVKIEDFYEPLGAYGSWLDSPEYGRVWQPAEDVAGDNFVPYAADGSWAVNDDGDWVFESKYETDWGWATYHYGRWADHADYGWVWVPGTVWAPSWVEWRYGGGYVGWVPMGPPGAVYTDASWFFVEEQYITAPALIGYRLSPDRVVVAYAAAPPVVGVRVGGRVMMGPPVASIRARGVVVRTSRTAYARAPARGYARATARTVTKHAASRPRPAPAKPKVKAAKAASHAAAAAAAHPNHPAAAAAHAAAAPHKAAAPPPKPAPKPAPPPAKKSSAKKK